jgi:hypothetical protein
VKLQNQVATNYGCGTMGYMRADLIEDHQSLKACLLIEP